MSWNSFSVAQKLTLLMMFKQSVLIFISLALHVHFFKKRFSLQGSRTCRCRPWRRSARGQRRRPGSCGGTRWWWMTWRKNQLPVWKLSPRGHKWCNAWDLYSLVSDVNDDAGKAHEGCQRASGVRRYVHKNGPLDASVPLSIEKTLNQFKINKTALFNAKFPILCRKIKCYKSFDSILKFLMSLAGALNNEHWVLFLGIPPFPLTELQLYTCCLNHSNYFEL